MGWGGQAGRWPPLAGPVVWEDLLGSEARTTGPRRGLAARLVSEVSLKLSVHIGWENWSWGWLPELGTQGALLTHGPLHGGAHS